MQKIKTTCPLNCWDQCAFVVKENNGVIVSIEPDQDQQETGSIICSKGKHHLDRVKHPRRLRSPLLKKAGSFETVSWSEALEVMAGKIDQTLKKHGPLSLLHFYEGGYNGLLKNIESRFFSALGGSTTHRGSLCWGAGLAAQQYDFGSVLSHPYHDLLNSNLMIIWGRNPANTSIHLLSTIQKARQKGTRIILIDPVQTQTSALADQYIRIRPNTDCVLALAMARVIIERELTDTGFIENYSSGFRQFAELCNDYSPEKAAGLTGIAAETIEELAVDYAKSKPAALLIGIGLQRHSNGGSTVRAIDALAAVTGNIGIPGGGANFANFRVTRYIDHAYLKGDDLEPRQRYYPKPKLAEALLNLQDPPIDFLYISRSNPLVQVGDSNKLRSAFSKLPFVVTSEHFMTDTAAASDLVLPSTYFLEEEDLFFNSMSHQYLNYGAKVVDPPGECRPEYDFLNDLAGLLGLNNYCDHTSEKILTRAIKPLTENTGITFEDIKERSPLLLPGSEAIPWAAQIFDTADRKYNFYSAKAKDEGGDALPCFREPVELGNPDLHREGFPYWFLTPHPRDSIHSTHRLPCSAIVPKAYINPHTAQKEGLNDSQQIRISSKRGSITAAVAVNEMIPPETVMVYEGWWHSSGAAVNNLTPDHLTDMGCQAAYYDCMCRIDS